MENITLGQIAAVLAFIVALGVAAGQIKKWTVAGVKEAVKGEFAALSEQIKGLSVALDKEDKEKTKNFLVARLNEIENGEKWGDIERQRFFEQYDHYTNDLNGNTYIKKAVEQYEAQGKIWR